MSRVVVVGAGVVGLTVAVELARSGHRVDVVARDLPRETASAVGPGLWRDQSGPGTQDPRRLGWAQQTRDVLAAAAGDPDDPDAVVRLLPGVEATGATGREDVVPVVDLPRHLDHLVTELEQHGGSLTRLQLTALPTGVDAVVECTGLGARHFGSDLTVTPVREQLAVVETAEPLRRWWSSGAAGGTSYVVPSGRRVLVGAAVEPGEWERTVRPHLTAGLVERAAVAVPELAGARVVGARVGLWPSRPEVRLERVGDVVHCSGLGPAGLTLASGCARDVALLLT